MEKKEKFDYKQVLKNVGIILKNIGVQLKAIDKEFGKLTENEDPKERKSVDDVLKDLPQ